MFFKRLSISLVSLLMVGSLAMGANSGNLKVNQNGKEVEVAAPLDLTPILTPVSPRCAGESNGKIDVEIFTGSGTAPFSYSYSKDGGAYTAFITGLGSPFSISNLAKGTYTVIIKDSSTPVQQQSTQTVTINDNPALTISQVGTITNPACAGGTVDLKFQASGGNGSSYTYSLWTNGTLLDPQNTTGEFLSKGTGNYMAVVTDGQGCTKSSNVISVVVPQFFTISSDIISQITCAGSFASVRINGVPSDPSTLVITNTTLNKTNYTHTNYVFSNLDAGTYTVLVTRNSCPTDKSETSFTIEKFDAITLVTSPVSPQSVLCTSDKATISVTVGGGKPTSMVKLVLDNNDGITGNDPETAFFAYGETKSFDNVPAGTYSIRAIDQNNSSCTVSTTYIVSSPSAPIDFATEPYTTNALCYQADGKLHISVKDGTSPYNYFVNDNQILSSSPATVEIVNKAGTYEVYATDANGCKTATRQLKISEPSQLLALNIENANKNVSCFGGNDGEIAIVISGGTKPYAYTYTGPSTGSGSGDTVISIGALKAGTYNITVTDKNNCTTPAITPIAISEPFELKFEQLTFDQIKCFGGTTSVITKATGGPNTDYNYKLLIGTTLIEEKSGSGIIEFKDLESSTYTLRVTSGMFCAPKDTTFVINARKKITINDNTGIVTVKCPGDDGQFMLKVSGESPFSYSVNGNPTKTPFTYSDSTLVSGLAASAGAGQTHLITVYDGNDCDTTITIRVIEPFPLSYTQLSKKDVTCKNGNNGSFEFVMTGGSGYYIATSNGIESRGRDTLRFSNLLAGTYNVTVTDSNLCLLNTNYSVIINEPADSFKISTLLNLPILCPGDSTVLTVGAGGGSSSNYSITVEGPNGYSETKAKNNTQFTLRGGTYAVIATDENNCKHRVDYTISEPKALVIKVLSSRDVSCFEKDDAQITFSVTGGSAPYLYGLAGVGSATIPVVSDTTLINGGIEAKATPYVLFVKDKNNCPSNTVDVTINEPTQVEFTFKEDSVECFGDSNGSITVTPTGGKGTYKYYLVKPDNSILLQDNNGRFLDLLAGEYKLAVKDGNNCSAKQDSSIAKVLEPKLIRIEDAIVLDSISCNGLNDARVQIKATGGEPNIPLQYGLSGRVFQTESIIENVSAGRHKIFVKDSRGKCQKTWSQELEVINPPKLSLLPALIEHVKCHNEQNGSIAVEATGGTGAYFYNLYDEGYNQMRPTQISKVFANLGVQSADPLKDSFTKYYYQVVDGNGCKDSTTTQIRNPSKIRASFASKTNVTCNDKTDGTILLNVEGGTIASQYKLSTLESSIVTTTKISNTEYKMIGLSGTKNYTPIVTDDNGCTFTLAETIEIINPPRLVIKDVITSKKQCNNSTDDSTVIVLDDLLFGTKGAYKYTIDNWKTQQTNPVFINVRQRTVLPAVKDSNDCPASFQELPIVWPDSFIVNIKKNEIQCWDRQYGTLSLEFDGGIGPYYVGINQPTFSDNRFYDENTESPTTKVTLGGTEDLFLYNDSYTIYIKDKNNCPAINHNVQRSSDPINTYSWFPVDTLVLKNIDPTRPKCNGSKGTIQYDVVGGTPPYRYWIQEQLEGGVTPTNQDDDGLIDVPTGKLLYAFVTDYYKCKPMVPLNPGFEFLTTWIEAINDTVKVEIDTIKQPYCPSTRDGKIGLQITDFLNGGVTFIVNKIDTTYDREVEVYSATIGVDEATDSIEVDSPDPDVLIKEWKFSIDNYEVDYKFTIGDYTIKFLDNKTGCDVKYSFSLSPDTLICEDIFPNFFTPNDDKQNDLWQVSTFEKSNVDLKIFTAYGELVYHYYGLVPQEGLTWDGISNVKGKKQHVPVGTYMYIYQPDLNDNKSKPITGTITILRTN
jgi:gliding motility-associated-like protein